MIMRPISGTPANVGRLLSSRFVAFSDRYAVVMTVSQGGTGSATSGPAVRAIFDALYPDAS